MKLITAIIKPFKLDDVRHVTLPASLASSKRAAA
jgi:nitrogen regulatory protein PII